MSRWTYLSHPINANTPVYGDAEPFEAVAARSIHNGDTCNTQKWSLSNHLSTHIDFPRHFIDRGKTFKHYPPEFWVCRKTCVVDISPVLPEATITPGQLCLEALPHDLELLLIKTGFSKHRRTSAYVRRNPAFSPHIAFELRRQCPQLRIVGFDAISLSSWTNRSLGREAHRAFLDGNHPILILEDMNLSEVDQKTVFREVIVAPLAVSNADAAPCLILAEMS